MDFQPPGRVKRRGGFCVAPLYFLELQDNNNTVFQTPSLAAAKTTDVFSKSVLTAVQAAQGR